MHSGIDTKELNEVQRWLDETETRESEAVLDEIDPKKSPSAQKIQAFFKKAHEGEIQSINAFLEEFVEIVTKAKPNEGYTMQRLKSIVLENGPENPFTESQFVSLGGRMDLLIANPVAERALSMLLGDDWKYLAGLDSESIGEASSNVGFGFHHTNSKTAKKMVELTVEYYRGNISADKAHQEIIEALEANTGHSIFSNPGVFLTRLFLSIPISLLNLSLDVYRRLLATIKVTYSNSHLFGKGRSEKIDGLFYLILRMHRRRNYLPERVKSMEQTILYYDEFKTRAERLIGEIGKTATEESEVDSSPDNIYTIIGSFDEIEQRVEGLIKKVSITEGNSNGGEASSSEIEERSEAQDSSPTTPEAQVEIKEELARILKKVRAARTEAEERLEEVSEEKDRAETSLNQSKQLPNGLTEEEIGLEAVNFAYVVNSYSKVKPDNRLGLEDNRTSLLGKLGSKLPFFNSATPLDDSTSESDEKSTPSSSASSVITPGK